MLSFKPIGLNPEVMALLQHAGLPTEDLADPVVPDFCGMWDGDQLCPSTCAVMRKML